MPRPWVEGELCWYAMDETEQRNTIITGHPPAELSGNGSCANPATVAVEFVDDLAPGPRKMCVACAVEELLNGGHERSSG